MTYESCYVTITSDCNEIGNVGENLKYKVFVKNDGNIDLQDIDVQVSAEDHEETNYILESLAINETKCVYTGDYYVSKDDITNNGAGDGTIDIVAGVSYDHQKHGTLSIPLKYKFTSYNPSTGSVYLVGADDEPIILRNNESEKSVTSQVVVRFVRYDDTNKQSYTSTFQCGDFAEMLHNNAELAGIKCGYVVIDGINHACNVFDTTDKGLIFIDCVSGDTIVNVEVGKSYVPRSITSSNVIYDSLGIVTGYKIYW